MTDEIKFKTEKGGEVRHRFVQTPLCPYLHKALRRIAVEKDLTLAELLREAVKFYLKKEGVKLCPGKRN